MASGHRSGYSWMSRLRRVMGCQLKLAREEEDEVTRR